MPISSYKLWLIACLLWRLIFVPVLSFQGLDHVFLRILISLSDRTTSRLSWSAILHGSVVEGFSLLLSIRKSVLIMGRLLLINDLIDSKPHWHSTAFRDLAWFDWLGLFG